MQGVLFAGTHSGSGKTTMALGLPAAWQAHGLWVILVVDAFRLANIPTEVERFTRPGYPRKSSRRQ